MDVLIAAFSAAATAIAAVAAVGTLLVALTRKARLRRTEAQWRQLLETNANRLSSDQRDLVKDLHHRTVVQLISLDLMPIKGYHVAAWLLLSGAAVIACVAGWLVGPSVASYELPRWWAQERFSIIGLVFFAILGTLFIGHAVADVLRNYVARHNVARDLLSDSGAAVNYPSPDGDIGRNYLLTEAGGICFAFSVQLLALLSGISAATYYLWWRGEVDFSASPNYAELANGLPTWVPAWLKSWIELYDPTYFSAWGVISGFWSGLAMLTIVVVAVGFYDVSVWRLFEADHFHNGGGPDMAELANFNAQDASAVVRKTPEFQRLKVIGWALIAYFLCTRKRDDRTLE